MGEQRKKGRPKLNRTPPKDVYLDTTISTFELANRLYAIRPDQWKNARQAQANLERQCRAGTLSAFRVFPGLPGEAVTETPTWFVDRMIALRRIAAFATECGNSETAIAALRELDELHAKTSRKDENFA